MSTPFTPQYPHVWLYCKYWYKRNDVITDLKTVVGFSVGADPKYITEANVLQVLGVCVAEAVTVGYRNPGETLVRHIIEEVKRDETNTLFGEQPRLFKEAMFQMMMSILSCTSVRSFTFDPSVPGELLIDLGLPDPACLPVK